VGGQKQAGRDNGGRDAREIDQTEALTIRGRLALEEVRDARDFPDQKRQWGGKKDAGMREPERGLATRRDDEQKGPISGGLTRGSDTFKHSTSSDERIRPQGDGPLHCSSNGEERRDHAVEGRQSAVWVREAAQEQDEDVSERLWQRKPPGGQTQENRMLTPTSHQRRLIPQARRIQD